MIITTFKVVDIKDYFFYEYDISENKFIELSSQYPKGIEKMKQYFESKDVNIYRYGKRLGAQGMGYSIYLKDPQGNEIELKEYILE